MTNLLRFLDAGSKGVWANIRMDNNDPCWIGVADTGVLVKKSKVGMFGTKLYNEKTPKAASTAKALHDRDSDDLTPPDMRHPLLKAFTNAALHCSDLEGVKRVLNDNYPEAEFEELAAFLPQGGVTDLKG